MWIQLRIENKLIYIILYSSLPPLCMLSHHSFNVWKKYRKKKIYKKDLKLKFWNVHGANFIVHSLKKPQKNGMLKKYLIIPGATGKPTGILDSLFGFLWFTTWYLASCAFSKLQNQKKLYILYIAYISSYCTVMISIL